ncbi:hypothetical protein LAZ67_15002179 [Cordylochernes scorpioides]|uniref:Uncharacterized protein n=1 Tax=Cordylochernes scorpioides TaxID=51811 RepID=A0ABY6LE66_9ARAC|nr:hypothetical protein LAZ67_15002179 [Cordylochernes scorpioides]
MVSGKRINQYLSQPEVDSSTVTHSPDPDLAINMRNATFCWSWKDQDSPVLKNVTLKVPPGSFVAIVGPVGSGKSALLSSLICDLEKLSGSVNLWLQTTNFPVQEMPPVSDISSHPMITRSKVSNSQCNFALADEPSNYVDAITSSDSERWKLAMDEEIDALNKNKTWTLERLADGHKPIGCKWVYKIKTESDGTIQRFKARLVAKGYSQIKNVDYFDTFSPVVRYDSLRILLSHAASERMFLKQFDVKTAFLNGELEELVYLEQPEGYKRDDNSCYRLHKSLYGLRQSSRNWNKKFTNFLYSHNFKTSDADPCIFIGTHNDSNVILALYVDDGIILSKDKEAIAIIMDELEHAFDITSGSVNFFVGLQIEQSEDRASIFIHQSSYIDKILSKFNMADCIPASVPMDPSVILTKQDCPTPEQKEKMPKFPFREAVGSLMFASCVSRPDITYAVSQALHTLGILFTGQDQLVGYSDSDFARDVDSRKSTTGYAFMMNGGTVSWASQRQPIIALSTTESEYIAACSAAKELIWIRRLLQGIGCDITKETELYIDNQAAIKLVENPVFHKRTKHIDVRYHFIRSKHEEDLAINMRNATFCWSWKDQDSPVLKNVTLKVPPGSFVAIVGPVGSGKSALLSSLICDLEKLSGSVNLWGQVTYCPQHPWIQNTSLRNNITFTRGFEPLKFRKVVQACALEPDLDVLPDGDLTEIGEKVSAETRCSVNYPEQSVLCTTRKREPPKIDHLVSHWRLGYVSLF